MPDSFHERIPALPDPELEAYARNPLHYRAEAVEAALEELQRRGRPEPPEDLARIREALNQRDLKHLHETQGPIGRWLGSTPALRRRRVRLVTLAILAAGFGVALHVYLTARPPAPNPLGYEPEDTKRYLRELEMVGGKANILAVQFRRWFDGLWHGRSLAFTTAWLTLALAATFRFVAGHPPPQAADDMGMPSRQAPR